MKLQLMMKILFTFTLYLISGPVGCADVIGYSGGSVIIISNLKVNSENITYICQMENRECKEIKRINTGKNHSQEEKFRLYKNKLGSLTVFIRKLKPQDAGTYTMGVGTLKTDVNLKVVNDSCCAGPKIMNASRGQNITFTCNYPAEYKEHKKYIKKIDNDSVVKVILNTGTQPQNSRFFFSDDRHVKVLSVNISDVSEDDDGFYLCGVYRRDLPTVYYSYFSEVQLQITVPTEISSDAVYSISSRVIIISVCVCVALLLIGGFALMIYKQRHKRILVLTTLSKGNEQVPPAARVYEEINHNNYISVSNTELYMSVASPTNPDKEIFFTVQPPQDQNLTYATVTFQKNPNDDSVPFSKDASSTEYATVRHQPRLE